MNETELNKVMNPNDALMEMLLNKHSEDPNLALEKSKIELIKQANDNLYSNDIEKIKKTTELKDGQIFILSNGSVIDRIMDSMGLPIEKGYQLFTEQFCTMMISNKRLGRIEAGDILKTTVSSMQESEETKVKGFLSRLRNR